MAYSSDLTDLEWEIIEPLLPQKKHWLPQNLRASLVSLLTIVVNPKGDQRVRAITVPSWLPPNPRAIGSKSQEKSREVKINLPSAISTDIPEIGLLKGRQHS
jgi:hypothetical protein